MTIAILGQALLLLALLAAAGGSIAAFAGGRRLTRTAYDRGASAEEGAPATGDRLADGAIRALHVVLVAALVASFLLLMALAGADYTLAYVQGRMSSDLPFSFRLTALWSGQEGSLLL